MEEETLAHFHDAVLHRIQRDLHLHPEAVQLDVNVPPQHDVGTVAVHLDPERLTDPSAHARLVATVRMLVQDEIERHALPLVLHTS